MANPPQMTTLDDSSSSLIHGSQCKIKLLHQPSKSPSRLCPRDTPGCAVGRTHVVYVDYIGYKFSHRAGHVGTPKRPLYDLGLHSYLLTGCPPSSASSDTRSSSIHPVA